MKIQKSVIFVKKNLRIKKDKKHGKVRDHCHSTRYYRGAAPSISDLKHRVPKKILIVFHNRSNYSDGFIMKEFVREFKKQFTCLEGNTKKYITFTVAL